MDAAAREARFEVTEEFASDAYRGLEAFRGETEAALAALREELEHVNVVGGGATAAAVEELREELFAVSEAVAAQQEQLMSVQAEGGVQGQAELLLQTREAQERVIAVVDDHVQHITDLQVGGCQVEM
jgi:hypothetical protein